MTLRTLAAIQGHLRVINNAHSDSGMDALLYNNLSITRTYAAAAEKRLRELKGWCGPEYEARKLKREAARENKLLEK